MRKRKKLYVCSLLLKDSGQVRETGVIKAYKKVIAGVWGKKLATAAKFAPDVVLGRDFPSRIHRSPPGSLAISGSSPIE
jgi:hypothetical protein